MMEAEARAVFAAATHADGGCSHCCYQVVNVLAERLPKWPWQDWADKWADDGRERPLKEGA